MSDPRLSLLERRFGSVRRILAFASGKGGVGKSCCSVTAALSLAKQGKRVGLLDLDFHGASDHLILGIDPPLPGEAGGILPIDAAFGLRYMGIAPFTREHGVALRGDAMTDAIRELLAVVIWGELDLLIVDMPPGIGEAILDLSRHLPQSEVVLVSTPSTLALSVMDRLVEVLGSGSVQLVGYLLNMVHSPERVERAVPRRSFGGPHGADPGDRTPSLKTPEPKLLGKVPYLAELEDELGQPDRLMAGRFAQALSVALRGVL